MNEDPLIARLRAAIDRFNAGERTAPLELFSPDVRWHEGDLLIARDTYEGLEEVARLFADNLGPWERVALHIDEAYQSGKDTFVVIGRFEGRINGNDVTLRAVQIHRREGDQIIEVRQHADSGKLLAALAAPVVDQA